MVDQEKEETNLLDPISRMALAGGPMKTTPSFAQRSAKVEFSDKNP